MSEQKRYTAQEMREAAGRVVSELYTNPFADMLRQAADAEEENAKLREENAKLTNIINTECNKCGDCAKFGNDCTAGDIDGAEDNRACEKFVSKEVAELRECLKDAVESYCEGCNDFVDGKQMCEPCECKARKWSKALAEAPSS